MPTNRWAARLPLYHRDGMHARHLACQPRSCHRVHHLAHILVRQRGLFGQPAHAPPTARGCPAPVAPSALPHRAPGASPRAGSSCARRRGSSIRTPAPSPCRCPPARRRRCPSIREPARVARQHDRPRSLRRDPPETSALPPYGGRSLSAALHRRCAPRPLPCCASRRRPGSDPSRAPCPPGPARTTCAQSGPAPGGWRRRSLPPPTSPPYSPAPRVTRPVPRSTRGRAAGSCTARGRPAAASGTASRPRGPARATRSGSARPPGPPAAQMHAPLRHRRCHRRRRSPGSDCPSRESPTAVSLAPSPGRAPRRPLPPASARRSRCVPGRPGSRNPSSWPTRLPERVPDPAPHTRGARPLSHPRRWDNCGRAPWRDRRDVAKAPQRLAWMPTSARHS